MKRTDAFKSNYLGQGDIERPTIGVIQAVGIESLNGDGGKEDKPVVHFSNGVKPMILNLINWQTIEDAYGDDSDSWIGKRIELYVDRNVMFGNKKVGGVRVRLPMNGASANMSFDQAVIACREVGISKEQMIAHLKQHGQNSYNPARDTATIRALIDTADAGQPVPTEEEIPLG